MSNLMTEQDENIRTVNKLYEAFRRRDISSLLDMFTDDAILHGLHPQVSCHGVVFTKVVGEWQISSLLLASHLDPRV
jgi:ketosteroid isomerase-like protein